MKHFTNKKALLNLEAEAVQRAEDTLNEGDLEGFNKACQEIEVLNLAKLALEAGIRVPEFTRV